MALQTIVNNAPSEVVRYEDLHGKQYMVVPVAMMTEGVHHGSQGPLFYPASEFQRNAVVWNMKPVVVYHPEINGVGISACDPDVARKQQIGMLMNTRWDGKLRSEAWLDPSQVMAVDPRVMDAITNGKVMEVSTGLFTDNEQTSGKWGDEEYVAVARNYQPDHLAVLPDKVGACSVADGAGLLQLNEDGRAANLKPGKLLAHSLREVRRLVANAMSFGNVSQAIGASLRAAYGEDTWTVDVYPGFVVYENKGKLYRLDYTTDKDGKVTLDTKPDEVQRVSEYRSVATGAFVGNGRPGTSNDKESNTMTKAQRIAALIANTATPWTDSDKPALEDMPEDVLAKLEPKADAPAAPTPTPAPAQPTANTGTPAPAQPVAPVTVDAYIAQAPAGIQEVLRNGVAVLEAQKADLIGRITANASNRFSKEWLATLPVDQLQGMAALCSPAPTANAGHPPMFNNYALAGGAAPVQNAGAVPAGEVLLLPSMDFSK